MSHYIKLVYNYLLIVDMNYFYVFDLEKEHIIATFQSDGEVTSVCHGNW